MIHSRDQDSLLAVQGRLDAPAGRSPAAVPAARAPATALETSSPALQGYRTPEPAPPRGLAREPQRSAAPARF
ncbi:hypothetical protein DX914_16375 [Lysobacter silvisoli]|uniref:Uncharacterized protein n=1 Tax=Lysobacter silvisoli TaxID=2293254 RepID=A0A371JY72_9GAMM|nr:hypothetical protein DX914_16375 [Lysobacter silvisoli]